MRYKDPVKRREANRQWRTRWTLEQRLRYNAAARDQYRRRRQRATAEWLAAQRERRRFCTRRWWLKRSDEQKAKDAEGKRRSKAKMRALRLESTKISQRQEQIE